MNLNFTAEHRYSEENQPQKYADFERGIIMITDGLTEIEQHYLNEWIVRREEGPIRTLMIISWLLNIIFFLLWGGICFSDAEYLTGLVIPGSMLLILACLTVPLLKRLKKHRTYVYDEFKRTKILSKEVIYYKNGKGCRVPIYGYYCRGIDELCIPVSKRMYDIAKVGDDITIVKTSREVWLGITFGED